MTFFTFVLIAIIILAVTQEAQSQLLEIPNSEEASRISEVDLPVWNQSPAVDSNINTPDRPNSTNIEAIDWQTNETLGMLYVWDAQYQNETVALEVPEYFNCVVSSSADLYKEQGIEFKNQSKAEYVKVLETCVSVQWVISKVTESLMEKSPMERALMGFQ